MCKSNPALAYDLFTTIASLSLVTNMNLDMDMKTEQSQYESKRKTERRNQEACPKGHTFTHLKYVRATYDQKVGKWKVRCPNCAVQKVCSEVDNGWEKEMRWDGEEVGFWYL